jgi:tetratricopeptide (TPR) repeat protein
MAMRYQGLIAAVALACLVPAIEGYELTGRIEPPAAVSVFLHGALRPYQNSTTSDEDGRFHFSKVPEGTYTLVISTEARGDLMQTVELSAGTVDSKGRLDIVLTIDAAKLESEGGRGTAAIVSATMLSIPERATREYEEAQRCLSRRDGQETVCAGTHLKRAVEIAPRFTAAWNQLGTMAYQSQEYNDAEAHFRKALEADLEAFEPLVNLGGVLLNLARPREALEYNQRAVARRPNNALANSQLGLAYFYLNDQDAAEKYLKIAVHLDPAHFSHPQLTLAEIYERRGDRASALEQLRDFLRRHPDSPQAETARAKIADLSR